MVCLLCATLATSPFISLDQPLHRQRSRSTVSYSHVILVFLHTWVYKKSTRLIKSCAILVSTSRPFLSLFFTRSQNCSRVLILVLISITWCMSATPWCYWWHQKRFQTKRLLYIYKLTLLYIKSLCRCYYWISEPNRITWPWACLWI